MLKSAMALGGIWMMLAGGTALAADAHRGPVAMLISAEPEPGRGVANAKVTDAKAACRATASTAKPKTPANEPKLDPLAFFQKLVDRYRRLETYKDVARVVQETRRQGAPTNRVETQIACEVSQGKLQVQTPATQVGKALGLQLPIKTSPEMRAAQLGYDLWLAPHLAMKFTEQPLKDLRAGVEEGFTATTAQAVTIDNKAMVHLALRSGDGLSEDCHAKFDLYVNSESMLIERIEGEQTLPDGASYSTTLHITPHSTIPAQAAGDSTRH